MKHPVLIVRTVSVEKLAPVLTTCAKKWPQHPLVVVSSPARGSELQTDPRITEIIPYATAAEGFIHPIQCEHALEAVVVPVANRGGSGYANVMRACQHLQTRRWFLASFAQELQELAPFTWKRRWRTESVLLVPARLAAAAWRYWIQIRHLK